MMTRAAQRTLEKGIQPVIIQFLTWQALSSVASSAATGFHFSITAERP
jgi:hypothetical protein